LAFSFVFFLKLMKVSDRTFGSTFLMTRPKFSAPWQHCSNCCHVVIPPPPLTSQIGESHL
jgi:hypothetical protein